MSPADLMLPILTTVIGVVGGIVTSFYFFRAQQTTDFNKLQKELARLKEVTAEQYNGQGTISGSIKDHVSSIDSKFDRVKTIVDSILFSVDPGKIEGIRASIDALRITHEKLNSEVNVLPAKIVDGFRKEQDAFLIRIQREFDISVDKSQRELSALFQKELAPLVPSTATQRIIIDRLIDMSGHAMRSIGQYHLQSVREGASHFVQQAGKSVEDSMSELKSDVADARTTVELMPQPGAKNDDNDGNPLLLSQK